MKQQDIVVNTAKKLLRENPSGMRFAQLVCAIEAENPELKHGTVTGNLCKLEQLSPSIVKPEKGLFKLADETDDDIEIPPPVKKHREELFYAPFAEWLKNELDECTDASAVGGNIFGSKWGTPDVTGIKEAKKTDILKFSTQLISAEIKTDVGNLITAFGQTCAYKLFSHKSYLVIPKKSGEDDLARMDSLCLLHGIGLIHFDNENAEYPDFEIRNRATTHEPDLFYTNRYVKILADHKIIFD